MELADLIVVNKADIDPRLATLAKSQIKSALNMLRHTSPNWLPPVLTLSALKKDGIEQFWGEIERYRQTMQASGEFESKRRDQAQHWMWELIDSGLRERFRENTSVKHDLPGLQQAVANGETTPAAAAHRLLKYLSEEH